MKETMQKHAAVFRVESLLEEGYDLMRGYWKEYADIHCHDKSRVWYEALQTVAPSFRAVMVNY